MSENRYRSHGSGPSRRDSDNRSRSPDHYSTSTDRYRTAPAASRPHDYNSASDRHRDPRITPRPPDNLSSSRRSSETQSRPEPQDSKMDADKASQDVANLLRVLEEALVEKIKWTNRQDTVLEGYKRRHEQYKRQKDSMEPSVAELYETQYAEYMREKDKVEQGLSKAKKTVETTTADFARLLVKALPIREMKDRQVIEARQAVQDGRSPKLDRQLAALSDDYKALNTKVEQKHVEVATTNRRTQKLEEQMASLLKTQEAQQSRLEQLQSANEELRALNASQAAEIASQKAQQDTSQDSQLQIWKQEKESLVSQISGLQAQLAELRTHVDSQQAEFSRSSEKVSAQLAEYKALDELVKQHDVTLSCFEPDEYTHAMTKLLAYPSWTEMNNRLQGQQTSLQRLGLESKGLITSTKREFAAVSERFAAMKQESGDNFDKFTEGIVQKCGALVEDVRTRTERLETSFKSLQARVGTVETRTAAASRAPSVVGAASPRPTHSALINGNSPTMELRGALPEAKATQTANQGLRSDIDKLVNSLAKLEQEVHEFHNAHEMMIMGLDEQFKNMTTVELAGIILDNLKKLPPNVFSVDIQNLHERVGDLEAFRQEQVRHGSKTRAVADAMSEGLKSCTEPPTKRQKLDGVKGSNGMGAG